MGAAADLTAAVEAARAVVARFHTASDGELLADADAVETLGRIADGLRLGIAAQLEFRSRKTLGEESLAVRSGVRDGVQLVQHTAGISHTAARRRVGLGAALAPKVGLDGGLLPGKYPVLAEAVAAGEVGLESARVIIEAVHSVRRRVDPDRLEQMLAALTEHARTMDTDTVREIADWWILAVDPDGAAPDDRDQRHQRALRLGRTLRDGTTRAVLVLPPEQLALLKELLHSRRRSTPMTRSTPGGDDSSAGGIDPDWEEDENPDGGDPRTRSQSNFDALFDVITAGLRAEHDGSQSTAVTHEVVVTISAEDLAARAGQGWTSGVTAGLPVPVVERLACTGGTRLLVTGPEGEALFLSRQHRVFSTAQKKALTIAAGGWCQYPGCTTRAPYLEAHHAAWWHRDHGDTSVDNGVMLCSFHHHLIHARSAPVEIRCADGEMWFVPKGWRGPFRDHQRRQRGPTAHPDLIRLRRRHDPARNPFLT